ncbi:CRISPR-associated endonuclease Cas2 [Vineibacter terrae]|uniref:CRISPR-associated endonuclease Cas2 n=1 Tax=Vineibacter terrae TaxID=2586908 RepID=UPI0015B54D99|nr:CRISPR-associated endonuclease Cas2 [Vineibacter terrae]
MRTRYLVCYDVSDPSIRRMARRLTRLRNALKEDCLPVQYSVFLGDFTLAGCRGALTRIARIIDPSRDDVRLYPLPVNLQVHVIGRPILPDGIYTPIRHWTEPEGNAPR